MVVRSGCKVYKYLEEKEYSLISREMIIEQRVDKWKRGTNEQYVASKAPLQEEMPD